MKLNRRQTLIGTGAILTAPWVRPSWAQAGSLNVYNWADYIGETTVADFASETGIDVVYDLYASSEEMQAKMLAGSSGYDLVLQSGLSLHQMVKAGVYQKIDRTKLTGFGNLDPDILKIVDGFDPGNEYTVPYMWGSVGITYNLDMVRERLPDADLESLDTLFLPENAAKLADCGISILDSPTDIGFTVLKWLGIDPDTAGPAEYEKMAAAFAEIRPYIATFDNANYLTAHPEWRGLRRQQLVGRLWRCQGPRGRGRDRDGPCLLCAKNRRPGVVRPLGHSVRCQKRRQRLQVHRLPAAPRGDRRLHQLHGLRQCQQGGAAFG